MAPESARLATERTTKTTSRGDDFYLHAVLGAAITVVTSIVPFSPLLGGAVAGYLHDAGTSRGTRVGLVSGAIASIPLAGVFFLLLSVMAFGSITTGEVAGPAFVVMLIGAIFLFVALYTVGLSAAGGYLGASFAASSAASRAADSDGPLDHADPADQPPRSGEDERA